MNISKNKVYLIILLILTVVIVVFVIYLTGNFQQAELPEEVELPGEKDTFSQDKTSEATITGYPSNLLEGKILNINALAKTITLQAKLSQIDPSLDEAERTIKIDNAEVVIYNIDTGTETSSDINELKEGDGILVATEESTFGVVATRLEYTAVKITKVIKNENL